MPLYTGVSCFVSLWPLCMNAEQVEPLKRKVSKSGATVENTSRSKYNTVPGQDAAMYPTLFHDEIASMHFLLARARSRVTAHVSGSLFGLLLFALLLSACSGSKSQSVPETQSYDTPFERVIVAAADAAKASGLGIESAKEVAEGEYLILASKYDRLRGEREPIRVADVRISVNAVSAGYVNVTIEQEKLTRTSTIGTSSSEQIDYPRRIYRRLERRLNS